MKKRIKILSSAIVLASTCTSIGTSITLINNNLATNVAVDSTTKNANDISLVPAQANGQNANISTNAGPITFNNNVITALDWYGNQLWQVNMSNKVPEPTRKGNNGGYSGSWKRAWFNWDYDRTRNILWVLGYGYNSNQSIYGIDANTGDFKYEGSLGKVGTGLSNTKSPYKFLTALSSGKVLAYGDPFKDYTATAALYNPLTGTTTFVDGNSESELPTNQESNYNKNTYRWYFYNLIPLTNGVNLAEVVAFDNGSGTTGDNSAKRASYNAYGILVDDELNFIGDKQSNGSVFKTAYKLADGIQGYRNTTITPQRDYFTLLNSQTVSVTYNTVSLFNTSDPNNIQIKQVKMKNQNLIQTWTVDSNDNLYFKFLEDGTVYKVDGDILKSGKSDFSPTTYLDLSSVTSNQKVKEDANNFLIFNVYEYTGQLMMIDASYYNQINIYDDKNKLDMTKNWGLAIAVKPNSNQNTTGDFYGVLNGSDSIQKSADFTIDQSVLDSKIPSEITKNDIKLENGAFFKDSDKKPFIISNIDDADGIFTLTANLYKIPWFSSTLPTNAVPKVVSYTFDGINDSNKNKAQSISKKVNWKTLNSSTDYDFMNMLPSNVKTSDVEALNPFQVSFQSQKIVDGSGNQLYPKTKYSVSGANDNDGTINVVATYEYVPMSVTYTDGKSKIEYQFGSSKITEDQVKTYTSTKTYTIFKKNGNSALYFMGGNQSQDNAIQTIDVSNVPQLKNLLSAGTLPSSFLSLNSSTDSNNSAFLQFIDTTNSKGYPISKMKFSVEADDDNGILTIKTMMPSSYSPDQKDHTYQIKYTGLNKKQSYDFSFKDVTNINNMNINTILPSSVDEGDIIKNFINYQGFDSNDFNVVLTPNDEIGSLNVQIKLNSKYASTIGNSGSFSNYSTSRTFSGFMTTVDYNNRFSVDFKGDDDVSLLDLKKIQADEITNAFGNGINSTNNLVVGGKTYSSLNEFVKDLLVSSKGTSIPSDWNSSSGVKTQVYVDNSLGLASFYVNISKDKILGANSDLNFVVTYSGFVKGNEVKTNDNLSFVSNNMLKNYLLTLSDFKNGIDSLTPTTFTTWAQTHIKDLITYKTGQYVNKLESGDYKVTITSNEVQSTVTITIDFGKLDDTRSLSEYSIQYTI